MRNEIITQLEEFVHKIPSSATIDPRNALKFQRIINQLCEKAPEAARAIARAIQERNTVTARTTKTIPLTERKRRADEDSSYRTYKSARRKRDGPTKNADQRSNELKCGQLVRRAPATSESMEASAETPGMTAVISGLGKPIPQELPVPRLEVNSRPTKPAGKDSVTKKELEGGDFSSQTEEIRRERVPGGPETITLSHASTPEPAASDTAFIKELIPSIQKMITSAVQDLHSFRHSGGPPKAVYQRILQSLLGDRPKAVTASSSNEWSDGSMWLQVLDMGSSQEKKVNCLKMLVYMGFWAWYNRQFELAKGKFRNSKNQPMGEKGTKSRVLDEILDRLLGSQAQDDSVTVTEACKRSKRASIRTRLYIGEKLSTKLVEELGLGILFSPDIWKYLKLSLKDLDEFIAEFKKDARLMELLEILEPEVWRLVNVGSIFPDAFYMELQDSEFISEDDLREVQINYPVEWNPLPPGALNDAVERLKKLVALEVLKKDNLDRTDAIRINKRVELTYDMFDCLCPGKWLDCWTINVAMVLSDKPTYVRFGISVPLEDEQLMEIERPLKRWSKTIANHQQEAQETSGRTAALAHFCPINHNNHFTLLKINKREKVIRHYDSMAEPGTISGCNKTKISRVIKEEFGHLGYRYTEAPTPQQDDQWSCGIRVIWNFRHVCNGLPIGSWDQRLDPEPMLLELVKSLEACVRGIL